MGQGTDSCGGWESEYDPYDDENLSFGVWTSQEGEIHVSKMDLKHLKNARRRCKTLAATASFTSEQWKWEDWVKVFDEEINRRETNRPSVSVRHPAKKERCEPTRPARGKKLKMVCFCGAEFEARLADLKRGWALTCSKRCAAIRREFGRPAAKEAATGFTVKQVLRRELKSFEPSNLVEEVHHA